jgi:hypothetical protein
MYTGNSAYLENLLTCICALFPQYFHLTPSSKEPVAVYHLPGFLDTIQDLNFQAVVRLFSPRFVRITYHPERPSVALPYLGFLASVASERARPRNSSRDTDLLRRCGCSSRGEPGTRDGPRPLGGVQPGPTCAQADISLIIGVNTLRVDMTLATELSNTLRPDNGA